jgi:hypothetical protein
VCLMCFTFGGDGEGMVRVRVRVVLNLEGKTAAPALHCVAM